VPLDGTKAPQEARFDRALVDVARQPSGHLIGSNATGVGVDEPGVIEDRRRNGRRSEQGAMHNVGHIFANGDILGKPTRNVSPGLTGVTALLLVLVGCALATREAWQSPVERTHPLVGRIWDVNEARFLDGPELIDRLASHRFVLLGEKHDNADHHRLQARIVEGLVAAGRRPAVAFEMLSVDLGPVLTETLAQASVRSDTVREAVRWDESGWPEWKLYRPIFEAALRAHLPIAAADLGRSSSESIHRHGLGGLGPTVLVRLGLDAPLSQAQRQAMASEIWEAHCGHAPEHLFERMVDMQCARDAHLAREIVEASLLPHADGAVLIAGTGHVRRDLGVPIHLVRLAPKAAVASVAFLEVVPGQSSPEQTFGDRPDVTAPFDYVWYTPRVDDRDPCQTFRERLHQMHEKAPQSQILRQPQPRRSQRAPGLASFASM